MKNFPNLKSLQLGYILDDFVFRDLFKFLKNNSLQNCAFVLLHTSKNKKTVIKNLLNSWNVPQTKPEIKVNDKII